MQLWSNLLRVAITLLGVYLASRGALCASELPQTRFEGYTGHFATVCATAYSPVDPVDDAYRSTKGKWLYKTADGVTDVREDPYGIAVPLVRGRPALKFGTTIVIPTATGYVSKTVQDRAFDVDDVGNGHQYFSRRNGCLHIDLRFRSHESAIRWAGPRGYRFIRVFIVTGRAPVYTDEDFRVAAR